MLHYSTDIQQIQLNPITVKPVKQRAGAFNNLPNPRAIIFLRGKMLQPPLTPGFYGLAFTLEYWQHLIDNVSPKEIGIRAVNPN